MQGFLEVTQVVITLRNFQSRSGIPHDPSNYTFHGVEKPKEPVSLSADDRCGVLGPFPKSAKARPACCIRTGLLSTIQREE
jgi:hypothetical protein